MDIHSGAVIDPDAAVRSQVLAVARGEIGVRELTGRNDGPRVAQYLAYCDLPEGHAWCAAFVSWCFGQTGFEQPRNPWSPSLFPVARRVSAGGLKPAMVFGLYSPAAGRINHAGLVERVEHGQYIVTIEGNSNNQVERRRRPLRTIYVFADWILE